MIINRNAKAKNETGISAKRKESWMKILHRKTRTSCQSLLVWLMGNSRGIVLMLNPTDHTGANPLFLANHRWIS